MKTLFGLVLILSSQLAMAKSPSQIGKEILERADENETIKNGYFQGDNCRIDISTTSSGRALLVAFSPSTRQGHGAIQLGYGNTTTVTNYSSTPSQLKVEWTWATQFGHEDKQSMNFLFDSIGRIKEFNWQSNNISGNDGHSGTGPDSGACKNMKKVASPYYNGGDGD